MKYISTAALKKLENKLIEINIDLKYYITINNRIEINKNGRSCFVLVYIHDLDKQHCVSCTLETQDFKLLNEVGNLLDFIAIYSNLSGFSKHLIYLNKHYNNENRSN